VEAIPALLHVSVFLFLAGLVISLFNIHHTVAYVALAASVVCVVVYTAITIMPAIYYNSPYTSPFSTTAWYISWKAMSDLLKTSNQIASFVGRHTGFSRDSSALPLRGKASPNEASPTDMSAAAYDEALRSDKGMISRALGWTLDRTDEEGELVQFAAGVPGFSRSSEVKDSVSILEEAPTCSTLHDTLWRNIIILLARSAKPGMLPDSKLLPESVRQERIKICLEALYFLPRAIETLLRYATRAIERDNKDDTAVLSTVFRSVASWCIAERLSKPDRTIHRDVTVAAQCVAAVLGTYKPDEESKPIVMRQLKIEDPDILNEYMAHNDSLLLRNLNIFLEYTALEYLETNPEKYSIVLSTTSLAIRKFTVMKAKPELQGEYENLKERIRLHITGSSSENASTNANKLLSMLLRPPLPRPPRNSRAAPFSPPPPPEDVPDLATIPTSSTLPARTSPPPSLHPVSPYSRNASISMASPTSYSSSPYNEAYPLMTTQSPNRFSHSPVS
jgi:hypothetical protein